METNLNINSIPQNSPQLKNEDNRIRLLPLPEKELFGGKPHRYQKGQINNPYGRPKRPEIDYLRKAIAIAKKKYGVSLWVHLIDRAYQNDNVLIAVIKKFIPDKIAGENSLQPQGRFVLICENDEPLKLPDFKFENKEPEIVDVSESKTDQKIAV